MERKFVKNDRGDVSETHTLAKRSETKRQRKDKITKRRGIGNQSHESPISIISLITSLNFNPDESLPKLVKLFGYDQIDMYLSPCEMHPEFKGPYIFPNEKPFLWLISLLDDKRYVEMTTRCFVGISAHEKKEEWVNRLIPLLPKFYYILNNGTNELKENIIWILSNMCIDSVHVRDLILSQKACEMIVQVLDLTNWTNIQCSAIFLKSLFVHKEAIPEAEKVMSLWTVMTQKVLLEHFSLPINHHGAVLIDILRCIDRLVRYSDQYKLTLAKNKILLERIITYTNVDDTLIQFLACEILSTLTELKETHPIMITYMPLFLTMLNTANPGIREEGGTAIANFAESKECLHVVCSEVVLSAINRQFEYTDVSSVLKQMYFTIDSIIITGYKHNLQDKVFPIMVKFIYRICNSLVLEVMPNLVSRSIRALKCLAEWNLVLTRDMMEEFDGLSRLDRLSNHQNIEIQSVAEELVEFLEGV